MLATERAETEMDIVPSVTLVFNHEAAKVIELAQLLLSPLSTNVPHHCKRLDRRMLEDEVDDVGIVTVVDDYHGRLLVRSERKGVKQPRTDVDVLEGRQMHEMSALRVALNDVRDATSKQTKCAWDHCRLEINRDHCKRTVNSIDESELREHRQRCADTCRAGALQDFVVLCRQTVLLLSPTGRCAPCGVEATGRALLL